MEVVYLNDCRSFAVEPSQCESLITNDSVAVMLLSFLVSQNPSLMLML